MSSLNYPDSQVLSIDCSGSILLSETFTGKSGIVGTVPSPISALPQDRGVPTLGENNESMEITTADTLHNSVPIVIPLESQNISMLPSPASAAQGKDSDTQQVEAFSDASEQCPSSSGTKRPMDVFPATSYAATLSKDTPSKYHTPSEDTPSKYHTPSKEKKKKKKSKKSLSPAKSPSEFTGEVARAIRTLEKSTLIAKGIPKRKKEIPFKQLNEACENGFLGFPPENEDALRDAFHKLSTTGWAGTIKVQWAK